MSDILHVRVLPVQRRVEQQVSNRSNMRMLFQLPLLEVLEQPRVDFEQRAIVVECLV